MWLLLLFFTATAQTHVHHFSLLVLWDVNQLHNNNTRSYVKDKVMVCFHFNTEVSRVLFYSTWGHSGSISRLMPGPMPGFHTELFTGNHVTVSC